MRSRTRDSKHWEEDEGELWYLKFVINLKNYLLKTTICVSIEITQRKVVEINEIEKINHII